MADEKLIFPIGFDLEEGVKEASKEWKSTYQQQLQDTLDKTPLKVKLNLDNDALKSLSKMSSSVKSETKKTEDALSGLKQQLKALSDEWNKLSASQRAGVEGSKLREQYRDLTAAANGYNSTLRSAVSAEDRLANAKNKTTKATIEQNAAYKTQSGYLQRLAQRMIAYASVAQVMSLLRNIREVTAEFELQRVALGSIIGDLNEANAMFEQIKAAAVKSPFQIKELVTYTKQLAAYKIESDELFETTQRLADVSAGLGVGMERLVLAYGQIRATGYLRASEVRQLTEAGIPIVEELAKKMTQLQGEMVSAADVMQLISERAISFGMVKEVFDDMTSAGGMFYKMQEKQSETLAGQWSNLKDSISIMYEEIGNTDGVNNAMKGMIGLVKSLAENWSIISSILISVGEAYLVIKLASIFQTNAARTSILAAQATREYERAVARLAWAQTTGNKALIRSAQSQLAYAAAIQTANKANNAFMRGIKRLWATIVANPIMAAVSALIVLVQVVVSLVRESNKLKRELAEIEKETRIEITNSVDNFERLSNIIKSTASNSVEHRNAMAELKRTYGEFLPVQDEAIESLIREKAGIEAVTEAIEQKIYAQQQEKKINKITENYGDDLSNYADDLRDALKGQYSDAVANAVIDDINQLIKKTIKEGGYNPFKSHRVFLSEWLGIDDPSDVRLLEEVGEIFKNITGDIPEDIPLDELRDYVDVIIEMNEEIHKVSTEAEAITGRFGQYTKTFNDFKKNLRDATGEGQIGTFGYDESELNKQKELFRNFIKDVTYIAKTHNPSKKADFNAIADLGFNKGKIEEALDLLEKKIPTLQGMITKVRTMYGDIFPDEVAQVVKSKLVEIADTTGYSMDKAKKYLIKNGENMEDWLKNLKSSLDKAQTTLINFKKNLAVAEAMGNLDAVKSIDEAIANTEKEIKFLEEVNKIWSFVDINPKGGGARKKNPWITQMEEQLKFMQDFHNGAQKLSKTLGQDAAILREQMIMLNRGLMLGIDSKEVEGSAEEMLEWYDKAIKDTVAKIQKFSGFRGLTVEQILSKETKNKTIQEFQALLQTLYNSMTNFETSQVSRDMEQKMKNLSDELSRTKAAKEFFDRMLGLTGDKQLAASLTVSIYGGEMGDNLGDDLAKNMAAKFQEQVQTYFGDIDISGAINEATGEIDPIKLEDLLTDENVKKLGSDNVTKIRGIINDLIKANADYTTSLFTNYEKFFDYEKRMTMVTQREENERKRIRESALSETEKALLEEASKKREQEQISAIEIEQLKDTADWEKTFEDLNNLGSLTVNNLISLLEEYIAKKEKAGEPIAESDMKTLMNELKQLRERYAQLDPFTTIKASLKDLTDATKEYREAENVGDEKAMADAQNKRAKALNNLETAVNTVAGGFQNLSNLLTEVQELLGIDDDSAMGEVFSGAAKALGFVATALTTVIALTLLWNSSLLANPLFATTAVIAALVGVVSAISNSTRKADEEIERQQRRLDSLSYSYNRLQESAERAFGVEYMQNYNRQLANLEAQVVAYERQLNAERSKGKKADEGKIRDYQEQIRDTKDAINDMYGSLSEKFLGTDLTSAARDFASAWIDAYKEFSNTTDAMKAKFQDMIQNMIVESLLAKVMERALEPVFTMIDSMGDGDFYSNSFWQEVMSTMQTATENGVVGAENVMSMLEQMGINLRGLGGEMTGISRDIATASEKSILGLAAGINTQNFYISQVPTKLDTIIGLLRGNGAMPQGSAITLQDVMIAQNQFLSHLPTIAQHTAETVAECKAIVIETRRTADALDRVIKPDGTRTTYKMNVVTSYQG